MKYSCSVILPTYNEAENIGDLIKEILKYVPTAEVIVVDDDSPDKTWQIAQQLKEKNVKVIRRFERGLPSAIARGIKEASAPLIAWMDCDFSHPPNVLPELIKRLPEYDVAIASRYAKGAKDARPFSRRATSYIFNLYGKIILGTKVMDLTSGFIVAKKAVLQKVGINEKGYGEYFIDLMYRCKKHKIKVVEVPYLSMDRTRGTSKTSEGIIPLLKHGVKYGFRVLKIRFSRC